MATPRILTIRDFNTSRYAQLADTADVDLPAVLSAAETTVEMIVGRPLAETTFTERHRPSYQSIYLRRRPVLEVTEVTRRLSLSVVTPTILDLSTMYIDKELGTIEFYHSLVSGSIIEVTYTAGYENVPEDLKQAMLMQAALYMFQDYELYGSGDAKKPGVIYMEDQIMNIAKRYRHADVAFTR